MRVKEGPETWHRFGESVRVIQKSVFYYNLTNLAGQMPQSEFSNLQR